MIKLFPSFNFRTGKAIADTIRQQLSRLGIECVVVGDITKVPPPDVVRSNIFACDAFLAIVSAEKSDWVQNEIGIAYAANKEQSASFGESALQESTHLSAQADLLPERER